MLGARGEASGRAGGRASLSRAVLPSGTQWRKARLLPTPLAGRRAQQAHGKRSSWAEFDGGTGGRRRPAQWIRAALREKRLHRGQGLRGGGGGLASLLAGGRLRSAAFTSSARGRISALTLGDLSLPRKGGWR